MKSKKKILTLLALVLFFFFSNILTIFIINEQSLEFNEKNQIQIKPSGFWNLTGSPIFIHDDDPNQNWSYTASHYAWCSGSGSWADPYVIANITINGQGSGNCIEIKNSDAYFIIQNCSLYNSGYCSDNAGIYLDYVDNGKIINNNCSNSSMGINLRYSNNNNTLSGNTANNNNYNGINLGYHSDNNTLSGNTANNNNYDGIHLGYHSNNNILSGNTANNNSCGIFLLDNKNNTLSGNLMNFCGIKLRGSLAYMVSHSIDITNRVNNKLVYYYVNELGLGSNNFTNAGQIILINCSNSMISGFNLSNSTTGIYLGYSNNNTLSGNTADNNEYGIYLYYSDNNTLSLNLMNFCGISLEGSLVDMASHSIDITNRVNNKPVYYYVNETDLGSNNFTNAGQIILINCSNSIISGENLSNSSTGIYLGYSNNNTLSGNTADNNEYGISLYYSDNNTLSGNNASNNNYHGIYISVSDNNTLSGNIACNNSYDGIYISVSDNNTLSGNTANNNYRGINLYYSNNNKLSGNNASNNDIDGIWLWYSINNTLLGNTACNNSYHGIYLSESNNNTLSGNTANNNKGDGIKLSYNSDNNTLSGNTANNNNSNGISLGDSHNNTLSANTASNNSYLGISLGDSNNNTLSGNTANNNSDGIALYSNSYNNILSGNTANNNNRGLWLYETNNNTLSGNTASYNNNLGISLRSSNNNTFSGNIACNNNWVGIDLGGNNNMLLENIANNNNDGIRLFNSDNNTLSGNIASYNNYNGIYLYNSSINTLSGNIMNYCGISLSGSFAEVASHFIDDTNLVNNKPVYYYINELSLGSSNFTNPGQIILINCSNSIISGFNLSNSSTGIYLGYSNNNTFSGNTINNNSYGIILDSNSNNNKIFLNNFIKNDYNAEDNGINNAWDDGFAGNYWGEYSAIDLNPMDGIGDDPFYIDGTANARDYKPLLYSIYEDTDGDGLINYEEYTLGDDNYRTNVINSDSDGDTFLDGIEANKSTNPLDKWWYPMPNLAIVDFRAEDVTEGYPIVLDFTILNNGIWRAEGIIVVIRIDALDLTLYNNTNNPFSLDEDESITIGSEVSSLTSTGVFSLNITIDPGNLINETYSLKDGNLRENWDTDNSKLYVFRIIPGGGGGLDELLTWIIIGLILALAIISLISFYLVVARPKLREKATAKRLIKSAKDDVRNFEINIRSFVKSRLKDNYKSIWWEEGIPEYIKQVVDNKINAIKPKKLDITLDKIDFLDFTHYNAIITDKKNWEPIFSDIFKDKTVVETNLESIRVFKKSLYAGKVTSEEMSKYTLFIYTISSYFTKGFNIFLSYSTLDTDYFRIKEVAKSLESYPRINKVLFWEEDSQENIVVYMEKTLSMSKVFIFFCSENAVKSKAVADEWQAAFQMRKKGLMKIVPVYEKEELIPNLLMPLLNVKYTKDDFDGFIQKLHDEILR